MVFVLRDENTTENPPVAQVYGSQITEGRLVYYIKEANRTKCILFLGSGEMDGIDRLYYNGEIVPEFTEVAGLNPQRNWKFHPGTKTTLPVFKDITEITTDTFTSAAHGYASSYLGYTFTTSPANATAGAVYTQGVGINYTVVSTISGGTTLVTTTPAGAPTYSGTLTKVSGTGDTTITFTASVLNQDNGDAVALGAGVDPPDFELPTGVRFDQKLYVVNANTDTFKLSTYRGGAAITGWPTSGAFYDYLIANLRVYKADAGFYDPIQGRPYFFSEGLTSNVPLDFTFSEIAYVEVYLSEGHTEISDEPNKFKIFVRGRRLQNYDENGLLADENGVAYPDQNNLPTQTKFHSSNNALVATDIMLNSMKISKDRVDWGTFVKYRDYCAESIGWNSGTTATATHPNWLGVVPINVTNVTNVTQEPANTYFKASATTTAYNAFGRATNGLTHTENPIEIASTFLGGQQYFGLTFTTDYTIKTSNQPYAIEVTEEGHLKVWKQDAVVFTKAVDDFVNSGDRLRIVLNATQALFYRNGVNIYSETKALGGTGTLRGIFGLYSPDAKLKDFSFVYNGLINAVEYPVGTLKKAVPTVNVFDSTGLTYHSAVHTADKVEVSAIFSYGRSCIGLTQATTPDVVRDNALYTMDVHDSHKLTIRRKGVTLKTFPANTVESFDTLKIVISEVADVQKISFYVNDTLKHGPITFVKEDAPNNTNPIRGCFFLHWQDSSWSDFKFYPVTGEGKFITRFQAHVVYPTQVDCPSALEQVFGHSPGCHWQDTDGKIKFIVGSHYKNLLDGEIPTAGDRVLCKLISFDPTQTDITSNIIENSFNSYRKPKDQRQNFLRAEYRDVEDKFYTKKYAYADRPALRDYVDVLVDFGIVQVGVASQSLAERIGEAILRWNTDLDLFVTLKGTADTLSIAKGDLVKFAHEVPGWTIDEAPVFVVIEETFEPNTSDERSFILQVYNPEFYSDTHHGPITPNLPPGDGDVLEAPEGINYEYDGLRLRFYWDASNTTRIKDYIVTDEFDNAVVTTRELFYIETDLNVPTITRRVRTRNTLNQVSTDYAEVTFVHPPTVNWVDLQYGVTINADKTLTTTVDGTDFKFATMKTAVLAGELTTELRVQPNVSNRSQGICFTPDMFTFDLLSTYTGIYFRTDGTFGWTHNSVSNIGTYNAGDQFVIRQTTTDTHAKLYKILPNNSEEFVYEYLTSLGNRLNYVRAFTISSTEGTTIDLNPVLTGNLTEYTAEVVPPIEVTYDSATYHPYGGQSIVSTITQGSLPGTNEVQQEVVEADAGYRTISYNGSEETVPLNWNATPSEIENALANLTTVGQGGNIRVTSPSSNTYRYTFRRILGATNVPQLVFTDQTLGGDVPAILRVEALPASWGTSGAYFPGILSGRNGGYSFTAWAGSIRGDGQGLRVGLSGGASGHDPLNVPFNFTITSSGSIKYYNGNTLLDEDLTPNNGSALLGTDSEHFYLAREGSTVMLYLNDNFIYSYYNASLDDETLSLDVAFNTAVGARWTLTNIKRITPYANTVARLLEEPTPTTVGIRRNARVGQNFAYNIPKFNINDPKFEQILKFNENLELINVPNTGVTVATFYEKQLQFTTGTLANNAIENGIISIGRTFKIKNVTTSANTEIRLYGTSDARTADASRPFGDRSYMGTQHKMILELLLDGVTGLTWAVLPEADGHNADSPTTADVYYSVKNLSGSSTAITITLKVLVSEI